MDRLRARHWLAVALALALIGAAFAFGRIDDPGSGRDDLVAAQSAPEPAPTGDGDGDGVGADGIGDGDDADSPERLAMDDDGSAEPSIPAGPVAPLTGLPVEVDAAGRPALMVKVDNHPRARPQTGLDQADIVFDLRAEGITRFAAVFQSRVPDPVGPVRSSRTSDFDLARGFDNPLYASSGGNDYVVGGLRSLPIVELTNRTRNEYFRDFSRPAPHNLYVNGSDLYNLAPTDLTSPEPWFQYRDPGDDLPPSAEPAAGPVTIAFTGSPLVTHEWDEAVGGWLRTQDGAPHLTVGGDQLAPENVLIFVTDYSTSPADPISPEVRSTGGGPLVVLTAGHIVFGTWERPTAEDKPILLDGGGAPIELTPGRTWVLMPEEGQVRFAPGQAVDGTVAAPPWPNPSVP